MEILFKCVEDDTYPDEVDKVLIKEIHLKTSIGWINVSEYFETTMNGNTYKFVI